MAANQIQEQDKYFSVSFEDKPVIFEANAASGVLAKSKHKNMLRYLDFVLSSWGNTASALAKE